MADEEWPVDMGEVDVKTSDRSNSITQSTISRSQPLTNVKRGRPRLGPSSLPQGVSETSGKWRVRVFYQSSQRDIGTFQTLEQATLANEIARSMIKKDRNLQLSAEDCERNFKLAKEAALASVPNNEMCSESTKPAARKLPPGVHETPNGTWQVRVWYQGRQPCIGTFPTLEQATTANEIARNMLKKDKGLQLSAEECERNVKLAREAALADVPDIFSSSGRGSVSDLEVDVCRDDDLEGGVSTHGRKRKLSRKMADALLDSEAEKKETIDQPLKKRQKETPKPSHEPGNDSKTTICTIVHNKQTFVAKICGHEGCTNVVTTGEVCVKHGAKCSHGNCMNLARRDGVCYEHGATRISRRFCEFEGCKNISVKGGLCKRHGAKVTVRICCVEGCTNQAHGKGGVCKRHGNPSSIRRCIVEGCNN